MGLAETRKTEASFLHSFLPSALLDFYLCLFDACRFERRNRKRFTPKQNKTQQTKKKIAVVARKVIVLCTERLPSLRREMAEGKLFHPTPPPPSNPSLSRFDDNDTNQFSLRIHAEELVSYMIIIIYHYTAQLVLWDRIHLSQQILQENRKGGKAKTVGLSVCLGY